MRRKAHLLKNFKQVFLAFIVMLLVMPPINVEAHTSYYLQTLIDADNFLFKAEVIKDKQENESNHLEKQSGNFYEALYGKGNDKDPSKMHKLYTYTSGKYEKNTSTDDPMIFNFPPKHIPGFLGMYSHNNATGEDAALAHTIKNSLIPGLNEALIMLNNGYAYTDFTTFRQAAEALANGTSPSWSTASVECGEYTCKITPEKGTPATFPKVADKPYSKNTSGNEYYKDAYKDDVTEITWESLISHAFFMYDSRGVTYQNNSRKVGALEEMIVGVVESAVNGIKSALDLYSIEDLAFNRNLRGQEYVTYKGVFSARSWDAIKIINVICQAIAWSMIGIAVAKLIIKRNWAIITTSPRDNVFFMDMLKDLILMAFVSVSAFFVIDVALLLNNVIVDVFSGFVGNKRLFLNINGYQGTLANCLIQVFELVITIYMNFVYIYRGFMIAILMAVSPIFIVAMAFGEGGKAKTQNWIKELGVNIFVQSFHAVILTFFSLVMANTRGLESLIACMALIPLTSLFKNMIVGESGVDSIAGNSAQTFTSGALALGSQGLKTAKGVAGAGINAAGTAAKDGADALSAIKSNKNKLSEAEASAGKKPTSVASDAGGGTGAGGAKGGSSGGPGGASGGAKGTKATSTSGSDSKNIPLTTGGVGGTAGAGKPNPLGEPGSKIDRSALQKSANMSKGGAKKLGKAALNVGKQAVSSGLDAGIGAATMAAGVAVSAAYGTNDGISQAKQGMRDIDNAMSDFGDTVGESYGLAKEGVTDSYNHSGGELAYNSGVQSIEKLDDGTYEVATDLRKVAGGSLKGVSKNEENGNLTYTFKSKQLEQSDYGEHSKHLINVRKEQGKDALKAYGVADIKQRKGETKITYTKEHMKKLGINGGRVENDQFIENKESYASPTAYVGPQFDTQNNLYLGTPKAKGNTSVGHTEMMIERLREQEAAKAAGLDDQISW